jgi:Transposase DDE domain
VPNAATRRNHRAVGVEPAKETWSQQRIATRDTPAARTISGQRGARVAPVVGEMRSQPRCARLTWRGRVKVTMQWRLSCRVHTIDTVGQDGRAAETMGEARRVQTRAEHKRGLEGFAAFGLRGNQRPGSVRAAGPTPKSLGVRRRPLVPIAFSTVSTITCRRRLTASAALPLSGAPDAGRSPLYTSLGESVEPAATRLPQLPGGGVTR